MSNPKLRTALLFLLVLPAAILVATWAAAFVAHHFGISAEQWNLGVNRMAIVNWAIALVLCPLAFFAIARRSDLYAAAAGGILLPGGVALLTTAALLWLF